MNPACKTCPDRADFVCRVTYQTLDRIVSCPVGRWGTPAPPAAPDPPRLPAGYPTDPMLKAGCCG